MVVIIRKKFYQPCMMSAKLDEIDNKLKQSITMRIIMLREASGKNQTEFAQELLGIDKQALQRVESGRGASLYFINKFCKALGMSLKDFFNFPLFNTQD